MNRAGMVRSYVETMIESMTGCDRAQVDDDGDYPVRWRNALYYVRVDGGEHPVVRIFSVAVAGVEPSGELLEALNEINAKVAFARVFHVKGQVLFETELFGETLDDHEFDNACVAVASATDYYGPLVADRFGGSTAFEHEKDQGYETASVARAAAGYL